MNIIGSLGERTPEILKEAQASIIDALNSPTPEMGMVELAYALDKVIYYLANGSDAHGR